MAGKDQLSKQKDQSLRVPPVLPDSRDPCAPGARHPWDPPRFFPFPFEDLFITERGRASEQRENLPSAGSLPEWLALPAGVPQGWRLGHRALLSQAVGRELGPAATREAGAAGRGLARRPGRWPPPCLHELRVTPGLTCSVVGGGRFPAGLVRSGRCGVSGLLRIPGVFSDPTPLPPFSGESSHLKDRYWTTHF